MNKHIRPYALPGLFMVLFFTLAGPAHADASIAIGVLGSGTPSASNLIARIVALIIIILLEAAIFRYLAKITWPRSLTASLILNLISTAAGLFWGGYRGYWVNLQMYYLFAGLICMVLLRIIRAPWWYILIAAITGLFGLVQVNYTLEPPQPPQFIAMMLWFPLIFGFGTTLFAEGLFARKLLPAKNPFQILFLANVASYVFLAIAVPFIASNPFGEINHHSEFNAFQSLLKKPSPENAVAMFHQYHAPNKYLLGITPEYQPPENYDAWFEITAVSDWAIRACHPQTFDPQTALAVIDDTLSYPDLQPDAMIQLNYMRQWTLYCTDAWNAIVENNQAELDRVYSEWSDCFLSEFYGASLVGTHDHLMGVPDNPIRYFLRSHESSLTFTSRDWEEEINRLTGD